MSTSHLKLLLSASALFGAGMLLLADSTYQCSEFEPLPADYGYELHCQSQDGQQQVSVHGMLIRKDDDHDLRNEQQSIDPSNVDASFEVSVLWDDLSCAGGEGVGKVDGVSLEGDLVVQGAPGKLHVLCSGARNVLMTKSTEVHCKSVYTYVSPDPSSSAPVQSQSGEPVPGQDAGVASDAAVGADSGPSDAGSSDAGSSDAGSSDAGSSKAEVSSLAGMSCSALFVQLPTN